MLIGAYVKFFNSIQKRIESKATGLCLNFKYVRSIDFWCYFLIHVNIIGLTDLKIFNFHRELFKQKIWRIVYFTASWIQACLILQKAALVPVQSRDAARQHHWQMTKELIKKCKETSCEFLSFNSLPLAPRRHCSNLVVSQQRKI